MCQRVIERWAVLHPLGFLLGKYYWPGATEHDMPIPTWRTRQQARDAARKAECISGGDARRGPRPVKVTVTISVSISPGDDG